MIPAFHENIMKNQQGQDDQALPPEASKSYTSIQQQGVQGNEREYTATGEALPMSQQFPVLTAPYTFRPANRENSTQNLADLFDLNEIFADEFYPADIDFSKYLSSQKQEEINQVGNDDWTDMQSIPSMDNFSDLAGTVNHANGGNSSSGHNHTSHSQMRGFYGVKLNQSHNQGQSSHQVTSSSSGSGGEVKNDVILIPPSLPRIMSSHHHTTTTMMPPPAPVSMQYQEREDEEEGSVNDQQQQQQTASSGNGSGGGKSLRSSSKRSHDQSTEDNNLPPPSQPMGADCSSSSRGIAGYGLNNNNNKGLSSLQGYNKLTHLQPSSSSHHSNNNSKVIQGAGGNNREIVEHQRFERRERNREHAKRSRVRKKLLLDSLQDQLLALRQYNMQLRRVVTEHIPGQLAAKILSECTTPESSLLASLAEENAAIAGEGQGDTESGEKGASGPKPSPLTSNIAANMLHHSSSSSSSSTSVLQTMMMSGPTGFSQRKPPLRQSAKILMEPDYRLIQSLVTSQQNFCLSDPFLPDNPIVYASDGFCRMTGYKKSDVLGRNCRFLQGPGTDQAAVDLIRKGIAEGRDISVCLLNYKADGKAFWNQFFLAALKDAEGQVVNYVGVQCEVNNIPVLEIKDRVKKLPIPTDL